MADITVTYKGNTIGEISASGSHTVDTAGKYCEADIGISYISPGGGTGIKWDLIGQKTVALTEYTNTSAAETITTDINIKNTDYAYILVVITCDTPIETTTEWGMTVALKGRYTTNGNVAGTGSNLWEKGSATLSFAALANNLGDQGSYGVSVNYNTAVVSFNRKCHATGCPKCRAGNYTVKAYGLKSL